MMTGYSLVFDNNTKDIPMKDRILYANAIALLFAMIALPIFAVVALIAVAKG